MSRCQRRVVLVARNARQWHGGRHKAVRRVKAPTSWSGVQPALHETSTEAFIRSSDRTFSMFPRMHAVCSLVSPLMLRWLMVALARSRFVLSFRRGPDTVAGAYGKQTQASTDVR